MNGVTILPLMLNRRAGRGHQAPHGFCCYTQCPLLLTHRWDGEALRGWAYHPLSLWSLHRAAPSEDQGHCKGGDDLKEQPPRTCCSDSPKRLGTWWVLLWVVLWSSHRIPVLRASPDLRRASAQGCAPSPSCGAPVSTAPPVPQIPQNWPE